MTPEISSALIVSCATLVAAFIPTLIGYLKIKKRSKYFVSTGLAIGYYYNFLRPVFEILEVTEIELEIKKKGTNDLEGKMDFDSKNVDIEIIIPRELTAPAIKQAQDIAYGYQKGAIVRKSDKRDFTVNFTLSQDNKLTIIDIPNPLNGVRQYIENLDEFKDSITEKGQRIIRTDTEKYRIRQKDEIKNFIDSINYYVKKEGYAINKLLYRNLN